MPFEAQKEVEIPCASSSNSSKGRDGTTVMELLDEYWFFHNMLDKGKILRKLPSLLASPQSKVEVSSLVKRPMEQDGLVSTSKSLEDDTSTVRTLVRTPPLPPRIRQPETSQDETSPSNLSSSKLRHSSSSLQCDQPGAASSPCSSSKDTALQTSITRHRPPRDTKFEGISRYSSNQRYMAGESKWRKAFREKKWKSLSDLEHEEVQGFKDLGFVFDKEDLNASLVRVIPGLRGGQPIEDGSKVQRPYLSEAWLAQCSAPPMMISWVNNRSADDMKEQLRFWARAVACNVRQEC